MKMLHKYALKSRQYSADKEDDQKTALGRGMMSETDNALYEQQITVIEELEQKSAPASLTVSPDTAIWDD
jgi:hypothetical protein